MLKEKFARYTSSGIFPLRERRCALTSELGVVYFGSCGSYIS